MGAIAEQVWRGSDEVVNGEVMVKSVSCRLMGVVGSDILFSVLTWAWPNWCSAF